MVIYCFVWLLPFFIFFYICSCIFNLICNTQPTPYIDELFHIPQTIKYCNGTYDDWDDKITTLPGLYIIAVAAHKLVRVTCTVRTLRFFNLNVSIFNMYLVYSLFKRLHKGRPALVVWNTINIGLFPLSYFFSFLFYTETLSTCLVLLMYRIHLAKRYWIAALIGSLSIMVRQTNVVWCGFLLLHLVFTSSFGNNSGIRFNAVKKIYNQHGMGGVIRVYRKKEFVASYFIPLYYNAIGYLVLCLAFVVFIFINDGIVIGDRSSHKPLFHPCQMFYFAAFTTFFSLPHVFNDVKNFGKSFRKWPIMYALIFLLSIILVRYFTHVHIYLISDNRHYSFYIWKFVFEKYRYGRYIIIPGYMFGFYFMYSHLKRYCWNFGYWLTLAISLIPHELVEFRYFIIPFIMFRIHQYSKTKFRLASESLFFTIINFIVFYVFRTKEFYWSDSKEIQRISW